MAVPAPAYSDSHSDAARLTELLTRQRDLYTRLRDLSSRQAGLISAGETEQLLAVLSDRQRLVEQLSAINDQIGPYRGRIADIADELPEPQRQNLRNLVDEVQGLLQSIIHQDEQDRKQLESARDQVGAQAGQAARTGIAINAYRRQPPKPAPRFADRAG